MAILNPIYIPSAITDQLLIEQANEQKVGLGAYRPANGKAMAFHHSTALVRCLFGANRSSKTRTGLADGAAFCQGTHPLQKMGLRPMPPIYGRIIATDYPHGIQKAILPTLRILCNPSMLKGGDFELAYSVRNMVLSFANGSFIEMMSYEQDLSKFGMVSRHFVHYDEEPPEDIRNENTSRLIEYNGWEIFTMTPEYGCTWVYDTFKLPWDMGNPDNRSLACWTMSIYENPYIDREYIRQKELELKDPELIRIKLYGEFVHRTGLVFGSEYFQNRTPWVYNDFKIPNNWTIYVGIDTHNRKNNAVVFVAVSPSGELWVFDEIFQHCSMPRLAAMIKEKLKAQNIDIKNVRFYIDWAAKGQDSQYGKSYYDDLIDNGIPCDLALKDPKVRVGHLWQSFSWDLNLVSDHPMVYQRDWPATDTGGPRIHICKQKCPTLIWQLLHYVWKDFANRRSSDRQDLPDVPLKRNDDTIDALGYVCMENPQYREIPKQHDPWEDHIPDDRDTVEAGYWSADYGGDWRLR